MQVSLNDAAIQAEYDLIVETLKSCNFNKKKASEILKIDRKTLYNKLNKYKDFKKEKETAAA